MCVCMYIYIYMHIHTGRAKGGAQRALRALCTFYSSAMEGAKVYVPSKEGLWRKACHY